MRNLDIIIKIVNISPARATSTRFSDKQHLIADSFVGDETGSVILTLWDDQIKKFKVGDVIELKMGYTSLYKGSLRLNIGKNGRVELKDFDFEVNTKNNLSETTHIRIPWRLSENVPYRKRRRR
jgi:replication factor A1